jgi:t-SNARE complex subunit (syntaxin)
MTEQLSALREQLDRGLSEISSGQTNKERSKKSFIPVILMITIVIVFVVLQTTNNVSHAHTSHVDDPLFQLF